MSIRVRDLRRAFRFLHEAAEAPGGDVFSRPVLRELGDLLDADMVEYFELRERDRFGLAYTTSRDVDEPQWIEGAFARFRNQNPIGAFRWTPADGAVRLSSVVSQRQLRRLELYEAFWGPLHIRDQLKVWLRRSPETAVCISMDRSDRPFTDRDQALLEALQPHLAAFQAASAPGSVGATRERDEVTLTRREAQVLSCAASGKHTGEIAEVLFMSPGTVRKHLEHAYAKLGVRSRGEAIAALMRIAPPR